MLASSLWVYTVCVTVLGLLIGSFLNVVIYRLPIMMQRDWQAQCDELRGTSIASTETFNLVTPRSKCPHCGHPISALENIPVLSFLIQQGKCTDCKKPISKRYPVIEAITGILSAIVAWHFGFGWPAMGGLLLTWALIALTCIDIDHQLLPDNITLPLLWTGILFNLFGNYTTLEASIIGAMAGYLSLWLVYHIFRLVTGKEGMGYGDFKLLAALGAWMGWSSLPMIILLSSLVGAIIGISLIAIRKHESQVPIPFGPYLAAAGWLAFIWGDKINHAYLHWAGLH